jgi:hypothetical protein
MRYLKSSALILSLGVILVGAQTTAALASGVTTLHVEVTEDHGTDPKVSLSLPFEVLEAFANSLDAKEFVAREIIDEMESEGFDLKAFWQQVRDKDIREFFTMRAEDAHVRAWREDGLFRVSIDAAESEDRDEQFGKHFGHFGDAAKVEIRIPESLMDYFVDEGEYASPLELLETLRSHGPMTLVEVQSEDESVRIWLD